MRYRDLFSRNIFSKGVLPYWCILFLDSATIVAAGILSVYITLGEDITTYFYRNLYLWVRTLPFFIGSMAVFSTYRGLVRKDLSMNMLSILCALLLGSAAVQFFGLIAPQTVIPYRPALRATLLMVVICSVLLCLYRVAIKNLFWVDADDGKIHVKWNPFNEENEHGTVVDEDIKRKRINLCLAHMSEEGLEKKYVKEAFDTNWVVPLGPNVNAFEKDLEAFMSSKKDGDKVNTPAEGEQLKVAALSAGTAAVHLALRACGVHPHDEVIVQSFTFCASSNPIAYLGAIPVFVDSEPVTWNMDPELLEEAIIDRKEKTGKYPKAIVPVALYGMPYQVDKIMAIADKYGIPVVEDAAEGLGSRYKGQVLGSFGQYGVLSFNGNKMITTSGGGALVCRDQSSKDNILWYATQAREAYPYYQHETIGYNYRMSNVCAGIGRGQMTVLDDHINHHKKVQSMYEELFADVPGITVHKAPSADYDTNYWLCTIVLDPALKIKGQENAYKETVKGAVGGAAGVIRSVDVATTDCQPNDNVEALRVWLDAAQIEARPLWKPMHKQPVYAQAPAYVNGVSESLFKKGMCLPSGPYVTEDDVKYIVKCIREAINV